MDRAQGRPLWPTLIVLIGTVAAVVLVMMAVSDRTPEPLAEAGDTAPAPPEASATPLDPIATPTPAATSAPTATPTPSVPPTIPVSDVPVAVLNQTFVEGLAARAADVLTDAGWQVGSIDNAALGSPSTTVYVPGGLEEDAALLTEAFPALTRTRPAFEGLSPTALTLVLAEPDAEQVVAAMEQTATGADPNASPFALGADAPAGR